MISRRQTRRRWGPCWIVPLPPSPHQQFLFDPIPQWRFHPLFKRPVFSKPMDAIQFLLYSDRRQTKLLSKPVSAFDL
jgi:hypothetical protein